MADAIDVLSQATGRDLHHAQVKFTYVGLQTKAVPTLAFSSFRHILDMSWFVPFRSPGLSYANDDTEVWSFSVDPDEMAQIVSSLAQVEAVRASHEAAEPSLSLMIVLRNSRLGDLHLEALVSSADAGRVSRAISDALQPDNGLARRVLALHREAMAL
jgi:hypothetical protein